MSSRKDIKKFILNCVTHERFIRNDILRAKARYRGFDPVSTEFQLALSELDSQGAINIGASSIRLRTVDQIEGKCERAAENESTQVDKEATCVCPRCKGEGSYIYEGYTSMSGPYARMVPCGMCKGSKKITEPHMLSHFDRLNEAIEKRNTIIDSQHELIGKLQRGESPWGEFLERHDKLSREIDEFGNTLKGDDQ